MVRRLKNSLSLLIAVCLVLGMLSATAFAANGGAENAAANMTALDALGIDSSILPNNYDPYEQSNPYGKNTVTINPVSELLTWNNESNIELLNLVPANSAGHYNGWELNSKMMSHLYGKDDHVSDDLSSLLTNGTETRLYSASGNRYIDNNLLEDMAIKPARPEFDLDAIKRWLSFKDGVDQTLPTSTKHLFSAAAAGNFVGATDGTQGQVAVLRSEVLPEESNLMTNLLENSQQNKVGSTTLTLLFTDPDGIMKTNNQSDLWKLPGIELQTNNMGNNQRDYFNYLSFKYQNYLQIETGDYDNDGYDEVAVYIPSTTNPRIEVYKLQISSNMAQNAYKNASSWKLVWTYSLQKQDGLVPNMVSLVSGDFNQDGTDDLAISYGHFYNADCYSSTRAAILYGSSSVMLQKYTDFPLTTSDDKDLVRVSFTYGNITDPDNKTLVLGGQVVKDIAGGNPTSRYVALYQLNSSGDGFNRLYEKNFNLFEKDMNNNYTYAIMGNREHGDNFYSLPIMLANMTTVSRGLNESGLLYFDSLIFEYGDKGLELISALDDADSMHINGSKDSVFGQKYRTVYVEFGADSADLYGNGYDTLVTNQVMGSWDMLGFVNCSNRWAINDLDNLSKHYPPAYAKEHYRRIIMDTNNASDDELFGDFKFQQSASNGTFCFLNCDHDTTYMQYTGEHYFQYSDPKVLAAIAAPPAFGDLLERNDLSGNYAESRTSYSSSTGSGDGSTSNVTISAGAYVSFEKSINLFGVEVARLENEEVITGGCTWEFEKTSMLTQSVEYGTTAGSDSVAFYSIPVEIYGYNVYSPNQNGEYETTTMTISMPHTASVRVLELKEYERIAKDYEELPDLQGTIFNHDVYDPSTYPTVAPSDATIYNGDWTAVGYSSTAGGSSITQTLNRENEDTKVFTRNVNIESRSGAGAGGVTVGIVLGMEYGAGSVSITMNGSEFSGEMQSMPLEAQAFGYGYNWKICSYQGNVDGYIFPVVHYLVSDVVAPSPLPTDFAQDTGKTTDSKVALTWTYDRMVAGFQLYRYYEFPDGNGSYELAFVPMSAGKSNGDGTYTFTYINENLDPYTQYSYQIQTVRAYAPNNSIKSETLVTRTKTEEGYPDTVFTGTSFDSSSNTLYVYPDATSSVVAVVQNASNYQQGVDYQWQMLSDGVWSNLTGQNTNTLTFQSSGQADQGQYRCRINVIYNSQYITAYSDSINVEYNKRTPIVVGEFVASVNESGIPSALVSLKSKDPNHNALPTGNVTFLITGADYEKGYTAALDTSGEYAVVSLPANATALPEGVYQIEAFYAGSRVFKSLSLGEANVLFGSVGYYIEMSNSKDFDTTLTRIPYGDLIYFKVSIMEKTINTTNISAGVYDENGVFQSGTDVVTQCNLSLSPDATGALDLSSVQWEGVLGKKLVYLLDSEKNTKGSFSVEIVKRSLEITIEDTTLEAGYVTGNLPEIQCSSFGERNVDPQLRLIGKSTSGANLGLDDHTLPGSYTLSAATNRGDVYALSPINTGTLVLLGTKYQLTTEVPDVDGSVPGTVQLASPELKNNRYNAGAGLYFVAEPYTGYEIEKWEVYAADENGVVTGSVLDTKVGGNTYSYITKAENSKVIVTFIKMNNTLNVFANPQNGGTIILPSYFYNGVVVTAGAQYSFTAEAAEGYDFNGWDYFTSGSTLTSLDGTDNDDGTNTVTITMPNAGARLYANFTRNGYSITVGSGLKASYDVLKADGSYQTNTFTGEEVLSGDTELTIVPLDGRHLAADAYWTVNGVPTTENGSAFSYTVGEAAEITALTETSSYILYVSQPEHGIIEAVINNEPVTISDEGMSVESDSTIAFTVTADYGYQAALNNTWSVNNTAIEKANNQAYLNLTALSEDTTVSAALEQKPTYIVIVAVQGNGSAQYVITDSDGTVQDTGTSTSSQNVTVYTGDNVTVTGIPQNDGFMVGNWVINNGIKDTRDTTYTFENISKDRSATVNFIPKANYPVTFSVDSGSDVNSLVVKADGLTIASGDKAGSGSEITLEAVLAEGKMVDYWFIQVGDNAAEKFAKHGNQYLNTVAFGLMGPTNVVLYTTDAENVTISSDIHGDDDSASFNFNPASTDILKGSLMTATVTSDEGYVLAGLTLTDSQNNEYDSEGDIFVSYAENDDGSISCSFYACDNLTLTAETVALCTVTIDSATNGTVTVTDENGSAIQSGEKIRSGSVLTIVAAADTGYKLGTLTVNGSDVTNGDQYTVASDIRITASFAANSNTGGGSAGGGGGGGGSTGGSSTGGGSTGNTGSSTGSDDTGSSTTVSGSTAITTAATKTKTNGTATVDVTQDQISDAVSKAKEAAANVGELPKIEIRVETPSDNDAVEVNITGSSIRTLVNEGMASLVISSSVVTMTFDAQSIATIANAASGDTVFTASSVENGSLSDAARQVVGDRPVYDFSVTSGSESISQFDGTVTISLPYTPAAGENVNAIVAYYINANGEPELMQNCRYDTEVGALVFTTTHFSQYAVGYNKIAFSDVSNTAWYTDAVSYLASRGITGGTSETTFSPDATLTRGQFITLVMRAYGIKPDDKAADNFSDAGNIYYTGYLAAAKRMGISDGIGDNKFAPEQAITRQQMFTLLYNALKTIDQLPESDSGRMLSGFKDSGSISAYAQEAMSYMVKTGAVSGNNGYLLPCTTTTRAQMAQVLYNLLGE